jgi:hypothetical protein
MIIHVYTDPQFPNEWCALDETGRSVGTETRLGAYRNIFNVKIHKGVHPDKSKRPVLINNINGARYFRIYWFEREKHV